MEVVPNRFAFSSTEVLAVLSSAGRAARTIFVASHHSTQMSFRILGETVAIFFGVADFARPSPVASSNSWTGYYRSLELWFNIFLTWLKETGYITYQSWIDQLFRWFDVTRVVNFCGKPFELGLTCVFLVIFAIMGLRRLLRMPRLLFWYFFPANASDRNEPLQQLASSVERIAATNTSLG